MRKLLVTEPSLPPLDQFTALMSDVWNARQVTNCATLHNTLEQKLREYLEVENVSLCNNATIALMLGLKALNLKGEVITTPFSFAATRNSIIWNGLTPIFIDVDKQSFNLNPNLLQDAMTPKTVAILPVHVYGNPCDTDFIEEFANKNNLQVIYDAAHCFGVKQNGVSLLSKGDLSIVSFHATKVFNSIEGAAVISRTKELKQKIDTLRNFGLGGTEVEKIHGLNAKMSELHAGVGLLNLENINEDILRRKHLSEIYTSKLQNTQGITLYKFPKNLVRNYAYYPIIVEPSFCLTRNNLIHFLNQRDIYPRAYFDEPLDNALPTCSINSSVCSVITERIMCLPMHTHLTDADVIFICDCINEAVYR